MAVVFKADSDFSKVLKDYERMQSRVVQLEQKLRDVTKEAKYQEGGFKATFEGGMSQLKTMIGGYASLQGAISLVNQGLAEQKRISEEIHRVQMTAADAQAEIVKNMGAVSTEQATAFIKDVEQISKRVGMPSVAPVYEAAAQTLSAVGDETLTKNILEKSLPFFKSKPEELAPFAGAVGDLAKIAGAQSPEEIDQLVSLVLSSQKYSRGATLEAFGNVAPAVAAVSAVDTGKDRIRSITEGLAMTSAISSAIADPDMALTKTATAEVATALAELLPEKDVLDASGEVKRKGTGLSTMRDRLKAVQADQDLQRRFFETGEGFQMASFRGPIAPVIKSLVSDPDSPIAKSLNEAFAGIESDPRVAQQIRANLEGATPQLEMAKIERSAKSRLEAFQLGTDLGREAQAAGIAEKSLEQTRLEPLGMGFLGDKARMAALSIDPRGKVESSLDLLRQKESEILRPLPDYLAAGLGPVGPLMNRLLPASEDGLSAERKEQLQLIRDQIKILEEIRDAQQRTQAGAGAAAAATLQAQREGR